MQFDHRHIAKVLPHSYPFLLVDRVLECAPGESITAIKNVTINEPFFMGHFRDNPVMPGVLIVEAMAQASMLCIVQTPRSDNSEENKSVYLMSIDAAKFRRAVVPGDVLVIKASVIHVRNSSCKFQCYAYVGDELASEAQVFAMIK